MSLNELAKFDFVKEPIGSIWKLAGWGVIGIPVGVAVIWGVYEPNSLPGVVGASIRRAAVSVISETKPVGERVLRVTSGNDKLEVTNVESDSTRNPDIRSNVFNER